MAAPSPTPTRDWTTCPRCNEVFDDPITLQCGHSICADCCSLCRPASGGTFEVECPECKAGSGVPFGVNVCLQSALLASAPALVAARKNVKDLMQKEVVAYYAWKYQFMRHREMHKHERKLLEEYTRFAVARDAEKRATEKKVDEVNDVKAALLEANRVLNELKVSGMGSGKKRGRSEEGEGGEDE